MICSNFSHRAPYFFFLVFAALTAPSCSPQRKGTEGGVRSELQPGPFQDLASCQAGYQRLAQDDVYGVYTRSGGLEEVQRQFQKDTTYDVVFLDLDHMHDANARWGYAEVDRRIRETMTSLSLPSEFLAKDLLKMRWYSGDEIVVITAKGAGDRAAQDLSKGFSSRGLSGTFSVIESAVVPVENLMNSTKMASNKVTLSKIQGKRSQVHAKEVYSSEAAAQLESELKAVQEQLDKEVPRTLSLSSLPSHVQNFLQEQIFEKIPLVLGKSKQ
jgi:GGDEF domain-containing protein